MWLAWLACLTLICSVLDSSASWAVLRDKTDPVVATMARVKIKIGREGSIAFTVGGTPRQSIRGRAA